MKELIATIRARVSSNPIIARRQILDFLESKGLSIETKMIILSKMGL